MINAKKYKRNSKLLAARSVIRRSIKLLTNKKGATEATVGKKTCASTYQGKFHQSVSVLTFVSSFLST